MAAGKRWTREELLIAMKLYSQIPFGRLHSRNPDIILYANLLGRTPSSLAMKLVNLASLDPYILDSGRKGLDGASNADRAVWQEMNQDCEKFEVDCAQAMQALSPQPTNYVLEDSDIIDFTGKDRLTLVKARVGQQLFRKRVLTAYDFRCCVTGLEETSLLVASHILPWKESEQHRLNPSNGLCLSNLHDRAFDQGLITFNEHLELVLSPKIKRLKSAISQENFHKYEGNKIRSPKNFFPDPSQLAFHREKIFDKKSEIA
ncbi:HNH endonuclease [Rouxiella chamberiensis]|uniref:HNH endonuclease n=1 Tax=Rouxiella chamberiensis TaxID=1513468 RepID=A0ABY7HLX0_9GAMM|nr:HNH endonuclease [Rouxiella chamberiensis]WAT00248.1 HNH endonuclease [Rouxiella chamberiensis]